MNRYVGLWLYRGAMVVAFIALMSVILAHTKAAAEDDIVPLQRGVVHLNGSCTAFHIGERFFVTAGHCIRKLAGNKATVGDKEIKFQVAILSNMNAGVDDFAVLRATSALPFEIFALGCRAKLFNNQPIKMRGYPADMGYVEISGEIIGAEERVIPRLHKQPVILKQVSATGGLSGAPVFNASREVVGIHIASLQGTALSLMTPVTKVCQAIDDKKGFV